MKILFASDLHGHIGAYKAFALKLKESDFSLGVLAGDLMTHIPPNDAGDIASDFKSIIAKVTAKIQQILLDSGKPVMFIMGNDDGIIEGGLTWPEYNKLLNINGKKVSFHNFNFIGYQYTPPFVGGLYEKPEDEIAKDCFSIGKMIDSKTILVTHGPPRGILDDRDYGSHSLRKMVDSSPPMLHLFGHIHQSFGRKNDSINGAFPTDRRFVGIDLLTLESTSIPVDV